MNFYNEIKQIVANYRKTEVNLKPIKSKIAEAVSRGLFHVKDVSIPSGIEDFKGFVIKEGVISWEKYDPNGSRYFMNCHNMSNVNMISEDRLNQIKKLIIRNAKEGETHLDVSSEYSVEALRYLLPGFQIDSFDDMIRIVW